MVLVGSKAFVQTFSVSWTIHRKDLNTAVAWRSANLWIMLSKLVRVVANQTKVPGIKVECTVGCWVDHPPEAVGHVEDAIRMPIHRCVNTSLNNPK